MSPADFQHARLDEAALLAEFGGWNALPSSVTTLPLGEAEQIGTLRGSGLFDANWYATAYAVHDADPLLHYHRQGWLEGKRPNFHFDPAWYRQENPDVCESGVDPLLHYIFHGEGDGRRPVPWFDPPWYREHHRLPVHESCLAHYLRHRTDGTVSPIPEFDPNWYLRTYPDVAQSAMDPAEHYMVQGFREARNPSAGFDSRFYRRRYLPDAPDENPLLHYLRNRHLPGIHPCMPPGEASIPREVRRFSAPGPDFEEARPLPASAPRRARVLAYYLPQFHAVPENDAWWGRGFTEWTNLARALPRFAGHYQPRIPRDLGHYTLDSAAMLHRQIALAKGAGLGGFVFYFYWFNGRRLLERPLEILLGDPSIDFPFCLMWANENWTRRWDGSDAEVLISQDYRAADESALIADFARHFRDPRYIRLQGRPLLMIYRPGLIPDAAVSIARWRAAFRSQHDEDPIFVMSQSFDEHDPRRFGLDGAVEFPPHKLVCGLTLKNDALHMLDAEFSAQVYDYDAVAAASLAELPAAFPLIKTAIPGWDNDARRQGTGLVVHGATPGKYQEWLDRLITRAESAPFFGEPLVCINAWNEWAEGAYLEPDLHFGTAFLNATGRAIAGAASACGERLVLVGHDAFPAGAQMLLLHLARRLVRAHGVQVHIVLLGDGALRTHYEAIAPVSVAAAQDLQSVCATLRERGFRRAIVNTAASSRACPPLKEAGLQTVLLVHEMPGLLREHGLVDAARRAVETAAHVVFAAEAVRDRFLGVAPMDLSRTVILPQGSYRPTPFCATARRGLRRQLGLAADAVLALGVGYADLRKGFDLFLQAWRAARRRNRAMHFAWVGAFDPALRGHLHGEIESAVATGTFHLPGFQEDVGAWFSAADVFLLTSREDPFPTVVQEALGAGLGVVAFAESGGIPDLLRRHSTGHVVPLGDVEAMARAAVATGRPAKAPARGRDQRAKAWRNNFDFSAYAHEVLRIAAPEMLDVSVVVPSYNYARYLPARLASIFGQSHPVREIIVLDDASTDGSADRAEQLAAEWGREIRVIRNSSNSGSVFRQWQRAAELARGRWLWIAEADDSAEPAFLQRLAAALANAPDALLAFCDSRSIAADGTPIWPDYRAYYAQAAGPGALCADDVFEADGFVRRFLAERNLILNASAVLWRRDVLESALVRAAADLPGLRMAGDWRLYVEALTGGPPGTVAYVAAPLNVHRRHHESVTHSMGAQRHLAEIRHVHKVARARLGHDPHVRSRQKDYLAEVMKQFARAVAKQR